MGTPQVGGWDGATGWQPHKGEVGRGLQGGNSTRRRLGGGYRVAILQVVGWEGATGWEPHK